jgi:hypothetical protein
MSYQNYNTGLTATHDGKLLTLEQGRVKTASDANEVHSFPAKLKLAKVNQDDLCLEVSGGAKFAKHIHVSDPSAIFDVDASARFSKDILLDGASDQMISSSENDLTLQAAYSGKKVVLAGDAGVHVEGFQFDGSALVLPDSATITGAAAKNLTLSAGGFVKIEDVKFDGSAVTFDGSADGSIAADTGKKLDITSNDACTWQASSGLLTIDGVGGLLAKSTDEDVKIYAAANAKNVFIGDSDSQSIAVTANGIGSIASLTAKPATDLSVQGSDDKELLFKVQQGGGSVATALSIAKSGHATFGMNVIVTGDMTVNGTTTTVNSTTLTVDDKNIELGSVDNPTDTTANGGGITLKGASDKTFAWGQTSGRWESSEGITLSAGKLVVSDATAGGSSGGSVELAGGIKSAKAIYCGETLHAAGTGVASATAASGGISTAGGLHIAKNMYAGGAVQIADLTEASSSGGALDVSGGVKIAKKLYVVSDMETVASTTLSVGSSSQAAALKYATAYASGDHGFDGSAFFGYSADKSIKQLEIDGLGNLIQTPADFGSRSSAGNAMNARISMMPFTASGSEAITAGKVVMGKMKEEGGFCMLAAEGDPVASSPARQGAFLGIAAASLTSDGVAQVVMAGSVMVKLGAHGVSTNANLLGETYCGQAVFWVAGQGLFCEANLPSALPAGYTLVRVGIIVGCAKDLSSGTSAEWDARISLDASDVAGIQ